MVDHTMPTPLQRSTKLKDLVLISVFTPSIPHLLSKHLEKPFFIFFFYVFFHSHQFNEMFIVSVINITAVMTLLLSGLHRC